MTLTILTLALGGAALLWIAWPFFRRPMAMGASVSGPDTMEELLFQKEALIAAARELDLDLETDKLSPEDHRRLRERCKAQAVAVMERLETLAAPQRAPVPETGTRPPTQPGATWGDGTRLAFCPHCGRSVRATDRFCARCGWRLGGLAQGE